MRKYRLTIEMAWSAMAINLCLVSTAAAGTQWIWQPTGSDSAAIDLSYTTGSGALYFFDTNGRGALESEPQLLVSDGVFSGTNIAFSYNDSKYTATAHVIGGQSWRLELGPTNDFGLVFNWTGSADTDFDYTITNVFNNNYLLTDGDTAFTVYCADIAPRAPVPLPASAAVLVAGLLSLIGFGVRKKQARM